MIYKLIQFLNSEIPNNYLSLISRFEDIFEITWKEYPISVDEFENAAFLEKWLMKQDKSDFYFTH